MRCFLAIAVAVLASGCAGYGSGLVQGQSTAADVQASMGAPAAVREHADGSRTLWYPKLPFGRESYAVRLDKQGRFAALEQRLDPQYIAMVRPNQTTAEEVLDILGPPYQAYAYPRMQREAWEYQLRTPPNHKILYVQFSPDRVVREVYQLMDPEYEGLFNFWMR